ncbi:MAG: hypothetical protein QM778_11775 [Myxococcales bacterium]
MSPGDGDGHPPDADTSRADGGGEMDADTSGDGGSVEDGGADGATRDAGPLFVSTFSVGDTTYMQTPSELSPDGFDPVVSVSHHRAAWLPYGLVTVQTTWSSPENGYRDLASVRVYTDGGTTMTGEYTIAAEWAHGNAAVTVHDGSPGTSERSCAAKSGTVSITDEGIGHKAIGSYIVTEWDAFKGSCPATPTAGSFEIAHEADDLTGNSGSQGDWFELDGTRYSEGSEVLYTPRVYARYNVLNQILIVSLVNGFEPDGSLSADEHDVELFIHKDDDTSGGTYPTGAGTLFMYAAWTGQCAASADGDASVTLNPYGDLGSVITGTVTVNTWTTGTVCPATPWTMPFQATLEHDVQE